MKPTAVILSTIKMFVIGAALAVFGTASHAGSIFLTGHDPDFHAFVGGNLAGARDINTAAINFVMDPTFNTFVATAPKFLFIESSISPPGGYVNGVNGIIASGYVQGVNFDFADASTLGTALNNIGQTGGYSAIVVASDFGGVLTQSELGILNSRSADIINFLNGGGGLYAMAESGNNGYGLTTSGQFGYLPFVVSNTALNQSEVGNTLTPFGLSLGLVNGDINGNASHNIFTSTGGMNVVDVDATGNILSLAVRAQIDDGGVITPVPEPTTLSLLFLGFAGVGFVQRRMAS